MFSFFRKKPKQPEPAPLPQPNYSQDRALVAQRFDPAYAKSLSNSNVKKLANRLREVNEEIKLENLERVEERALQFQENQENIRQFLKQLENEEAAEKLAKERKNQASKQKELTRNQRLNNLTRKYSYKTRQNLMNNAGRQRGPWRAQHPTAPYMSIENFANSPYFQPHSLYTGTNNNASTISYNSPRSVRSNRPYSPYGGKRRKTRRSKH